MRAHVAIALLLAACSPDGLAIGVPFLELPEPVVIVDARFGVATAVTVSVRNSGTAPAELAAGASPASPVAPDAEVAVEIVFTPATYDPATGVLVLTSGADRWDVAIQATVDRDGDDDGHDALAAGGDDCDDGDAATFPGAVEACDG